MKIAVYSYSTDNIGDEVQSIAAKRLLPRVDKLIERDRLTLASREPTFLIANGWHLHSKDFPPPPQVRPFYIAFHAANNLILKPQIVTHLKAHGPVGCRDIFTLERMKFYNVPAYLSGCLTLTLEAQTSAPRRDVLLVDVDPDLRKFIPASLTKNAISLTQHSGTTITPLRHEARLLGMIQHHHASITSFGKIFYKNLISLRQKYLLPESLIQDRFQRAENLLSQYEKAKLVITSRLHCALPCIAMGTPVIFLHKDPQDPRLGAINGYLKVYSQNNIHQVDWTPGAVQNDQLKQHKAFLREAVGKAAENGINPFLDYNESDLEKITSSFTR